MRGLVAGPSGQIKGLSCRRSAPCASTPAASRPKPSMKGTASCDRACLAPGLQTRRTGSAGRPQLRRISPCAATATAHVAVLGSLTLDQAAQALFAAGTAYTAAIVLAMLLIPRARIVRRATEGFGIFLPLALAYGFLLYYSWTPDMFSTLMPGSLAEGLKGWNPQFFPQLSAIAALFAQRVTAASLWLHLLAINLFAARTVYLDGLRHGAIVAHSLLLCAVCGPVGVLSHIVTKALQRA